MAPDIAGEDPGAHLDAGAGVQEIPLGDAVAREPGKPARVDLHEPDVAGSIGVAAHGAGIEAGLRARDGVEQFAVQSVALGGLVPAGAG